LNHPVFEELEVKSAIDGSMEKNLFHHPGGGAKTPMVVGLHTWSADRFNQIDAMFPECVKRRWALLLPEFRGPNLTSNPRAAEACASPKAIGDILDAVASVVKSHPVDTDRIFLCGGSGGGHMTLMTAAASPETWRGVSSWVPITDLEAWHSQNKNYAPHIEACCGGPPEKSEKVRGEYRKRSPLSHVERLRDVPLFVHHGRFDNSVPFTHTLNLARELERLAPRNFFHEIFDGGHELRFGQAFEWFDHLLRKDTQTAKSEVLTG